MRDGTSSGNHRDFARGQIYREAPITKFLVGIRD